MLSIITARLSLEPNSFVPLYEQLSQQLRHAILTNALESGSLLASESELAEALGVSRVTIRKALEVLEDEQLIVRRRGKGTFVAPKVIVHDLDTLHTLSEVISEQSEKVKVELLERSVTQDVPSNAKEALAIPEGASALLIRRLHIVDETPVVLASIYVHAKFDRMLRTRDLITSSVYALLETQLGIRIKEVREFISADQAVGSVADALQIPQFSPVMVMESMGIDTNARPIDHTTFYFRPDRYKFTLRVAKS